jgi:hypothetical protein
MRTDNLNEVSLNLNPELTVKKKFANIYIKAQFYNLSGQIAHMEGVRERERDPFLMFSLDLDIRLFGGLPHSVGCGRQLSSRFTSKC